MRCEVVGPRVSRDDESCMGLPPASRQPARMVVAQHPQRHCSSVIRKPHRILVSTTVPSERLSASVYYCPFVVCDSWGWGCPTMHHDTIVYPTKDLLFHSAHGCFLPESTSSPPKQQLLLLSSLFSYLHLIRHCRLSSTAFFNASIANMHRRTIAVQPLMVDYSTCPGSVSLRPSMNGGFPRFSLLMALSVAYNRL